jgi:hypothetical protein
METRSLFTGLVRAVLVFAAAGLLAVCAPPLGNSGGGNLRIVLAGGAPSGARALSSQTIAGFSYQLDFSGPGGRTLSRTLAPGTQTLTLNLALGDWTIRVEALNADGVLYGSGETTITVKAGTNEAPVTMSVPSPLTTIAAIRAYLAAASGSTAASVLLPVALDLTSDWNDLLAAIDGANKYVVLDLSASTINGMTSNPGEFDPDYTISTGKSRIVSLVLPDTAESIATGTLDNDGYFPSFRHFTGLTSITGRNLTGTGGIGGYAFYGCTSLTSVHFPAVITIGDSAFAGCTGLTTADFPLATVVSDSVFSGCTSLTTVYLPEVITIGFSGSSYLFENTGSADLTVTLGNTVPTLGEDTFSGVSATKNVTIRAPSGAITDYGSASYDNTDDTTPNWGNAFRGLGWDVIGYLSGVVNTNITLTFETYTP